MYVSLKIPLGQTDRVDSRRESLLFCLGLVHSKILSNDA